VTEHFDVIIVGTGAGGGTLASVLAPSGKRILLLERGDFLPREHENWDPGQVYSGDIVAVCAGAANSARILLRSAPGAHPGGLANGSGQLGRNYMYHNSNAVVALGKEPNDTSFQKTLGINDFYLAGDGRDWPLGNIQMVGKSNAMAMKGEEPSLTRLVPSSTLEEVARHAVDFWLTTEDVPKPDNRVTLDGEGNIHLTYQQTNDAEAGGLYSELRKILDHVGLATSVLDVNCKAHEVDNLYVVDSSFFPSIGAVNPALTIMANAIRVGEHLLARLA
jgi:choline dehydrogenase-like flavoprotein